MKEKTSKFFTVRATMTLLMMMLTATAGATTETLTFTFLRAYENNYYNSYLVYGGDNYKLNADNTDWFTTATTTAGGVTVTIDYSPSTYGAVFEMPGNYKAYADGYRYQLNNNYSFTLSFSASKYISLVKVYCTNTVSNWEEDFINNTNSCSMSFNTNRSVYKVDVTLSDTKPLYYFDISYVLNGGTNDSRNPATYEMSAGVASFYGATRTGYHFDGWFDNVGFTGSAVTGIPANTTGDKTLYAKWTVNQYTISFDTNGGTPATISPMTQDYGSTVTPPAAPTRTGYDFTGWSPAIPATMPAENSTHTAQWSIIDYAIDYTLNGGTVATANPTTYNVETDAFTLNNPTRTGYTFTGWTGSNGTTPQLTVTIAKGSTGERNYTANWTIDEYAITYDLDGGTVATVNPATYTIETETFTLNNPTRANYSFAGWTGSNGTTPQLAVTIAKGSTGERNYTANWIPRHTITFVTGDGATAIDPITQDYDTDVTPPANPTRKGYTFTGWVPALPAKMPDEDITLTAQWEIITYNITYDLDGGSVATANPATYTVETETFTLNNPTRTGYDFTGWVDNDTYYLETTVTIAKGSTGDKSFTARWNSKEVTDWATAGNSGYGYADAYVTYNAEQLDLLAERVNAGNDYAGKYFRLGADITYTGGSDTESNFTAIGKYDGWDFNYFSGTFDGDGHTISGIRIYRGGSDDEDGYQGLFGCIRYATIKNVTLADAHITGHECVAGIAGYCNEYTTIENCHVANDDIINAKQSGAEYHGGIVGYANAYISKCTSAVTLSIDGAVSASSCNYFGGIAGGASASLSNNLVIGATIPAVGSCYGAVVGEDNGVSLYNNYYSDCTVGGTANATGVGLDNADVTTDDGAVPGIALYDSGTNASSNATTIADNADAAKNVVLYGRTLYKDGAWNTLVLPFALDDFDGTPLENAVVKTLTSSDFEDGTLTMNFSNDLTSIAAGVPYIVKWASGTDIVNPVFSGVTISNTTANVPTTYVDFIGMYSPEVIYESGDKHNLYLGSGNNIYYPTREGYTVKACRAYFRLKNGLTAGDPNSSANASQIRSFNLNFGEESEVQSIANHQLSIDKDVWYSIDGRRLNGKPVQGGLYIHNGKKIKITNQ